MVNDSRFKLSILFTLLSLFSFGQILQPVHWSSEQKDLGNGEYLLLMKAKLDSGWHLYSTHHADGGIGIPTAFIWSKNPDFSLVDELIEKGDLHDEFVEAFGEKQLYFSGEVVFSQKVKATSDTSVEVEVMFQSCDDEKCLPPDYHSFKFDLKAKKASKPKKETAPPVKKEETTPVSKKETTQTTKDTLAKVAVALPNSSQTTDSTSSLKNSTSSPNIIPPSDTSEKTLWETFILGFLGGFAALLMPCIFPMIPLTVSMFTKQGKNKGSGVKKALIYGISIIVIYVVLGLIITFSFGPDTLNAIATNPWVNLIFFALFLVFAISFFGAFEITLPSKWVNSADKGADKGGLIGIFFMALTLALVSFSCTGPIIGSLLVDAATSGAILAPAIGMFGFALALALPFTLFAIFPGWLHSLPSSGGWLNTVKVSLGFIELAFAMKFLSNADLTWQLHWLEREVFLAFWIAIFTSLGLYLFNFFRMKHDSPTNNIGTPRLLFGILSFVVSFYLLPGMWGAPLKLVSGLIPQRSYSEAPLGFGGNSTSPLAELPNKAHLGPHQIPVFHDIDEAFAYAKSVDKPVMIDFTGDACANCRKVEDNVWSDPRVKAKLSNDVVLASLYVDRAVTLPKEQQVFSEEKGRKLRNVGDKWSAFQIKHFKSNSQPLYIIVDENMNRYTPPMGAEMNIENYLKWIDSGIKKFHSRK